jgi:prenyltransferase beta subunit
LLPDGRKGGGATLMGCSSSESGAGNTFCALAAAATVAAGRVSSVSTVTDTPPSNCK